ncbi:MAG TPA: gamma-glutamyl-gamma-aminobutyrate hydrolase family protein [Patescibacteria group bacterium]|nr:gamma-glutamyl-gamma-aminobutyrate hydrolase family protein [Patescibacteria group bacterium]
MKKPVIGITTNLAPAENTVMTGMLRAFVGADYVESVVRAGGIPLLLPPVSDRALIREQLEVVDGLILSGGADVSPLAFGEEPIEKLGTVDDCRDQFELELARLAAGEKKPLLGICRGIQVLNVAYGGTLFQDLGQIEGCNIKHFQSTTYRDAVTHTVVIEPGSALADIVGAETVQVNSFHHQSLKKVAPGLSVTAYSRDGVVEAVESRGEHFVLGIQWHPELLTGKYPAMLALFEALIKVAKKTRE